MLLPLPLTWPRALFRLRSPINIGKSSRRHVSPERNFSRWFDNRAVGLVVMEACGTAHHWARTLRARGFEVRLLPALYVKA